MRKLAVAAAIFAASSVTQAAVIYDWSPVTTGGTVTSDFWTNERPGQHFAESVTLGTAALVNGIDIYNSEIFGSLGTAVVVTIWDDLLGGPGAVAAQFFVNISEVDGVGALTGEHRLHADFAGFAMAAATTYWIGMTGDALVLTQTGLSGVAGGDSRMWQFSPLDAGGNFTGLSVGDMAFRLHANDAVVPAPATLALLGLGLAGLGFSRRSKALQV